MTLNKETEKYLKNKTLKKLQDKIWYICCYAQGIPECELFVYAKAQADNLMDEFEMNERLK